MDKFDHNGDAPDENEFDSNFGRRKPKVKLEDVNPDFDEFEDEDKLMKIDLTNDPRNFLDPSKNHLMESLSNRAIANSLIPKVSVLKKALNSADIYIKLERILEEFNSMIYYNSVIEMITWIIGLI